jgi:hypothetical protein
MQAMGSTAMTAGAPPFEGWIVAAGFTCRADRQAATKHALSKHPEASLPLGERIPKPRNRPLLQNLDAPGWVPPREGAAGFDVIQEGPSS